LTLTNQDADCRELLRRIREASPDARGVQVLSDTLEQLRWVRDMPAPSRPLPERHPVRRLDTLPPDAAVACPGVPGAYTHMASVKLFPRGDIRFFEEFSDVVEAVVSGEAAYGVLPVENSSAGQVGEVLELIAGHQLYISLTTDIKVEHCLCIHPDSDPAAITEAVSHPQALLQCRGYLERRGLSSRRHTNTAAAAKELAQAPAPVACICSALSAELYGLRILEQGIQDFGENYTRFVCVSPRNILLPGADTISITLSLPHEPGYLAKLLTRFAACSLDLSRLVSKPIASRDFSVLFYLDFHGSILDPQVEGLLGALGDECDIFYFHGNFHRLP